MDSSQAFMKAKTHFLKDLSLNTILEPEAHAGFNGTKVVITAGPSCQDPDTLAALLSANAVGCRVDLTWGPLDFHRKSFQNLQIAMKKTRRLCATVVDTLGRELMIRRQVKIGEDGWPIHEESYNITAGMQVILTTRTDVEAHAGLLPITYHKFTEMAQKGDTIYIGRYLVCGADSASLYLEVQDVVGPDVICTAKNDALLDGLLTVFHAERSADGLSNVQNELPLLSDYDKECLQILSQEFEIDFVSLSYCREAQDIKEARSFLSSIGLTNTKVLAKLETRQSLLNFQAILNEADGVIISRGNLGLDCVPEKMALVQKTLIQACNLVGKPVLITRVVDTMVNTPRPTRAEATDVANAVLDGVDGILLGAETLRGKYPVETVETICNIARAAEKVFDHHYHYEHLMEVAQANDEEPKAAGDMDSADGSAADTPAEFAQPGGAPAVANGGVQRQDSWNSVTSGGRAMPTLKQAAKTMVKFSQVASVASLNALGRANDTRRPSFVRSPYLSKLESIASASVRAAEKVKASLIIVYTHTGKTAQLVAKYRPPMPILTLVVPHLVSESLRWRLEGRSAARQCLLNRGMMPVLAAPSPSGDALLEEAVAMALANGLVAAHDYVVCVQRINEDFCVKVVAVDELGLRGSRRELLGPSASICERSGSDSPRFRSNPINAH